MPAMQDSQGKKGLEHSTKSCYILGTLQAVLPSSLWRLWVSVDTLRRQRPAFGQIREIRGICSFLVMVKPFTKPFKKQFLVKQDSKQKQGNLKGIFRRLS